MAATVKVGGRDGSAVEIAFNGATVLSWITASGADAFFVSSKAERQEGERSRSAALGASLASSHPPCCCTGRPIRGGIPLAFPQFAGAHRSAAVRLRPRPPPLLAPPSSPWSLLSSTTGEGPLPIHGLARTLPWECTEQSEGKVVLELHSSPSTLASWPHPFHLSFTVAFDGNRFSSILSVHNTGEARFSFQALQHTYYAVDALAVTVEGLQGQTYLDKMQARKECVLDTHALRITAETDAIFLAAGGTAAEPVRLITPGAQYTIQSQATLQGSPLANDIVVWNPWVAKAKALPDFGDEEYRNMICIEPGCVAAPLALEPGGTFQLQQDIRFDPVE